MKPIHLVAAFFAGIALVVSTAACLPDGETPPPAPTSDLGPTYTLPPCAQEDSENCYWDAATRGNGVGDSFVNLAGVTYYETPVWTDPMDDVPGQDCRLAGDQICIALVGGEPYMVGFTAGQPDYIEHQ